jgi:6-phosphogluconolactonase
MKIITADKKEIEKIAANLISKKIKEILKKKSKVILGIVGGNSVIGVFKKLRTQNIPWKKVHIFMVDERIVKITNKESNFKIAKDNFIQYLIDKGKLLKDNVHPFILERKKDYGLKEYVSIFKKHAKKFDIVLLSSGPDCHIASLFPNYTIKNNSNYFILVKNSPKPPKLRITASKKLLLKSKIAILLFIGQNKKQAYNKFLNKNTTLEECPAKLINHINESYLLTNIKKR